MTMTWRKSPETLVARFAEALPDDARVERRKMFGYPCAFVAGNMFTGLHQESLIVRLSERDRATFLALEGAHIFEPMAGRTMREYAVVPDALLADQAALRGWLTRSLEYASTLPAKEKKAPKATGRGKR